MVFSSKLEEEIREAHKNGLSQRSISKIANINRYQVKRIIENKLCKRKSPVDSLTDRDVLNIRQLRADGVKYSDIIKDYYPHMDVGNLSNIARNKTRKDSRLHVVPVVRKAHFIRRKRIKYLRTQLTCGTIHKLYCPYVSLDTVKYICKDIPLVDVKLSNRYKNLIQSHLDGASVESILKLNKDLNQTFIRTSCRWIKSPNKLYHKLSPKDKETIITLSLQGFSNQFIREEYYPMFSPSTIHSVVKRSGKVSDKYWMRNYTGRERREKEYHFKRLKEGRTKYRIDNKMLCHIKYLMNLFSMEQIEERLGIPRETIESNLKHRLWLQPLHIQYRGYRPKKPPRK